MPWLQLVEGRPLLLYLLRQNSAFLEVLMMNVHYIDLAADLQEMFTLFTSINKHYCDMLRYGLWCQSALRD